ncbi:MAG: RnfABCDGE type electron transport complex subunit G [Candidatus Omnitrophota bacterium]
MKETARLGLILFTICFVAAGLLSLVNKLTASQIEIQKEKEEKRALEEVLKEANNFQVVKENNEVIYYKALDDNKKIIGYVFKARQRGYSSDIETMVGINVKGKILAIRLLSQNETPGLGSRITESEFTDRFKNKDLKSFNEVDTITGATISSKAVIDSVKQKLEEILKKIN